MDIIIRIFGNRVAFRVSTAAGWFWAPDDTGSKTTGYTGPNLNTGTRKRDWPAAGVEGLEFQFIQTKLSGTYVEQRGRMGTGNMLGKSNTLGIEMSGPFSWMARVLKSAGAKSVYGVRSPKVLFRWTAKDLAKYCDRIALATQNGSSSEPSSSDDEDD